MQDSAANCGPASLSNALAAIGVVRSQEECATLCRTTATDGTPPKRLLAAITAVGRKGLVIKERRPEVAITFLAHWLQRGRPAILCVDQGQHWVAAVGAVGERVLVADSADNDLVLSYSREELLARWAEGKSFWGVVV